MPRKAKPQNENNPLKQLRRIFRTPEDPISQGELSEMTGVPLDNIRAIEAGRRAMNEENSLDRIRRTIYAEWDDRHGRWIVSLTREPFTPEAVKRIKELKDAHPYLQDVAKHVVCLRVLSLLDGCNDANRDALFLSLNESLEQLRDQFRIHSAKDLFRETTPTWNWVAGTQNIKIHGEPLGKGFILVKNFEWLEKHPIDQNADERGVLDFRDRRKSKPSDHAKKRKQD
jgi:hypothetical protein